MRQIPEKQRAILTAACASIRDVTGRLVKAYALLMALTFAELSVGFLILGVPMGFTAACLITLVDILPVLGTGTILLPWAFVAWTRFQWQPSSLPLPFSGRSRRLFL